MFQHYYRRYVCGFLLFAFLWTNTTMENEPGLKIYFLLKMVIFQPAMLVHWRMNGTCFLSGCFNHPPGFLVCQCLCQCLCLVPWALGLEGCHCSHRWGASLKSWCELVGWFDLTAILARWWFQTFLFSTPTWGRFPFWLIFFKWVETTN